MLLGPGGLQLIGKRDVCNESQEKTTAEMEIGHTDVSKFAIQYLRVMIDNKLNFRGLGGT